MDVKSKIRAFLSSRRARITSDQVGLKAMELSADAGLTMFAYTAEPGSRDEETLRLLGSWAATLDQMPVTQAIDHKPSTTRRPDKSHRVRIGRRPRRSTIRDRAAASRDLRRDDPRLLLVHSSRLVDCR